MLLDRGIAVLVEGRGAGPARNGVARGAGDRERAQVLHAVRQVAEPLADEDRRRPGAERLGADLALPRAADVPVDAYRGDRLARVVLVELVLHVRREVVEALLHVAAFRRKPQIAGAEADAEIRCDALREVDGRASFRRGRRIVGGAELALRDRRQRQLVGDEGIVRRRRGGEEALPGEAVAPRQSRGQEARGEGHGLQPREALLFHRCSPARGRNRAVVYWMPRGAGAFPACDRPLATIEYQDSIDCSAARKAAALFSRAQVSSSSAGMSTRATPLRPICEGSESVRHIP